MPVVVEPADYDRWLGLGPHAGEDLETILRPSPAGTFVALPVDPRVNTARFDDPGLIDPIGPAQTGVATEPGQLKLF